MFVCRSLCPLRVVLTPRVKTVQTVEAALYCADSPPAVASRTHSRRSDYNTLNVFSRYFH